MSKAIKKLTKKLGRAPTDEEVAAYEAKKSGKEAVAKPEPEPEPEPEPLPVKTKKSKKEKKEKKEKKREAEPEEAEEPKAKKAKKEKKKAEEENPAAAATPSSAPTVTSDSINPNGITKVFLGNLSWSIDDDTCKEFFKDCGEIVDLFWLTDKESGKFKGAGFATFDTAEAATKAAEKNGTELLERPIKVEISKPREDGKVFTPKKKFEPKPMSAKPDGCCTVFLGNLSYDIDDDSTKEFFKDCGEIANIRWLTDRETGAFKGCGFVEFTSTESVDAAAKLNGQPCLGRDIRIDYAESKKKSW